MKRILIFSLAYYPRYVGGAEVAIREITDRISPEDIDFHLITLRFDKDAPSQERIGRVTVHRVGVGSAYLSKVLFIPLAALKGRKLSLSLRFDAAWAMMSYMLFPILLMRALGVSLPYVLTLQEGDTFERVFGRWFLLPLRPLFRYGFAHASTVQTISKFLSTWARTLGYEGPIHVVPNGANPGDFRAEFPKEELDRLKHSVGKKEGDVFIVSTSRLVHKNALDDVVRALALLPQNVHFLVVGGGEDEQMLRDLAQELSVASRVHFVGNVDRTMTPKYRRIADIFARPSRSEGMGNSLVGAFAAGIPVIATQEGGIADFLFDAKRDPDSPTTGWAVDKDSPAQIAEAVRDIMSHPEQVRKVVQTAGQMAVEKYDWDTIARDMRDKVFAEALAR